MAEKFVYPDLMELFVEVKCYHCKKEIKRIVSCSDITEMNLEGYKESIKIIDIKCSNCKKYVNVAVI